MACATEIPHLQLASAGAGIDGAEATAERRQAGVHSIISIYMKKS